MNFIPLRVLRTQAISYIFKLLLSILLTGIIILNILSTTASAETNEKIVFKNPDFIRGMDISSVISLENSGVTFKNENGEIEDIFKILSDNGVNYIRVRVWNNPYNSDGNGYGGGNNDVAKACEIGRRASLYGMKLLVDFHYSDFWADPSKQKEPKEWTGLTADEKAENLYSFTFNSLTEIRNSGAKVGMVQIGNETNSGIAGVHSKTEMAKLFNAGSEAVRDFDKNTLVALHFTNPEKSETMKYFADYLNSYKVDYDVFASSYYPYWHGSLSNLTSVFNYISSTYGKYTMVAETSYAHTLEDSDGHPNTVSKWNNNTGENLLWDFNVKGQAEAVKTVMSAVNEVKNGKGLGVFYWEGAWITVGDTTNLSQTAYNERVESNRQIWDKFGSGWASSYSSEYDPDDAGLWYGGSAVDNQAFFDPTGKMLPSLKVFKDAGILSGDANSDGYVNISDATAIQKHVAKLIEFDSAQMQSADMNGDEIISIADATLIQKLLVS